MNGFAAGRADRAGATTSMSHPESTEHPATGEQGAEDSSRLGLVVDGRYRIIELIGRGGMGTVFKAEHIGIGRTVAVKLLHPSLAGVPEIAKRFEREARAIGRIEHPNCVDVSDSGKIEDGSLFLVMEYLEGESVGDLMADHGRVEPTRALHIMRHVLRGLGHAHQRHIVHRDIKPENIFLVKQGGDDEFAKILDFGIAKLVGSADKDSVKLTQAGVAFGTPVYMSPEQAVGNPVDGRADLYAATVVLYEMIAGKPPFYSDDKIEVLSMHTTRPPPPLAEVAPGLEVAPEIEALLMRGLAKRPGDRFADAAEYIAAIDQVLSGLGSKVAKRLPQRTMTAPVTYGSAAPSARKQTAYPAPISRTRLLIGVGAIGALVLVALIVAFAASGDGDSASGDRAGEAIEISLTDRAQALLLQLRAQEAIELLEGAEATVAEDPAAQLLLGHAYATADRPRDALRAYERAITLDEASARDGVLRTKLREMTQGPPEVALDAADILLGKLGDEVAAERLVELASGADDLADRKRARELADKHGLTDRVDLVASYARDLVQGERCDDRQEVVEVLRELGDPAAIPYLEKARYRRSSNPKYRGQNINGCLREDAETAIEELQKAAERAAEKAAGGGAEPAAK
jgi:serine/threonine-protein kinase